MPKIRVHSAAAAPDFIKTSAHMNDSAHSVIRTATKKRTKSRNGSAAVGSGSCIQRRVLSTVTFPHFVLNQLREAYFIPTPVSCMHVFFFLGFQTSSEQLMGATSSSASNLSILRTWKKKLKLFSFYSVSSSRLEPLGFFFCFQVSEPCFWVTYATPSAALSPPRCCCCC